MNLVTVIPLSRGVFAEELSYYSAKTVSEGDLVEISIRGKKHKALVIAHTPLTIHKAELKASRYSLKKIEKVLHPLFMSPQFLAAARKTARYYAAPISTTLSALLPKSLLDAHIALPPINIRESGVRPEKYLISDTTEERFSLYKKLVRESFVGRRSVLIIEPTREDVLVVESILGRGIGNSVRIISGETTKTEIKKISTELIGDTPLLIIGTAAALALSGGSIETIIIDRENTPSYKMLVRPFIDARRFAEYLADESLFRLIIGDSVLRTETMTRLEKGEFVPLVSIKTRIPSRANIHLVNMREEEREAVKKKKAGKAIGTSLTKLITETIKKEGNVVLFGARRGTAPSTVCSDCGETVRCTRCDNPAVLHSVNDAYLYTCHRCGHTEEPPDGCKKCGSWRLTMLGVGTEKTYEEARELFPNTKLFCVDSDNARSRTSARERITEFYATRGSILIGTEMILPFLVRPVDLVAVVSIDTLLVIPDFRIGERLFVLLNRLREQAMEHFFIQTRDPESVILLYASRGQLAEFHRAEAEVRKILLYPPFSVLIKISRSGKQNAVLDDIEALSTELREWSPAIYASPKTSGMHGSTTMHILLRLAPERWPHERLIHILKELSPRFLVDIDPLNIL